MQIKYAYKRSCKLYIPTTLNPTAHVASCYLALVLFSAKMGRFSKHKKRNTHSPHTIGRMNQCEDWYLVRCVQLSRWKKLLAAMCAHNDVPFVNHIRTVLHGTDLFSCSHHLLPILYMAKSSADQ